ncbi:TPA: class I SAM-dependent methyltransferase [Candidatus Woesearchaeota archaeon]|nr:class I SAM-dependent methyltransferase [Candidatus Woesearchaeota archaeon]
MRLFNKYSKKSRENKYKIFIKIIKPKKTDKILDVGSGLGTFLEEMYPYKNQITSLDINNKDLKELKRKYQQVRIIKGSALKLPFKDKSIDIIFSNAVIEHVGGWKNQELMAKEIQRVAKKWFVTTPNKWFPFEPHYRVPFYQFVPKFIQRAVSRITRVGPNYPKGKWQDINLLSARQMRKLFPKSKIIKHKITIYPETLICIGDKQ